jgi:hypothetical protein
MVNIAQNHKAIEGIELNECTVLHSYCIYGQSVSGGKQSNKNLTVRNSRSNNIPLFQQIFTTNYMVVRGKCVTEWRNCCAQL